MDSASLLDFSLVPVTDDDRDLLYRLALDPVARLWSFDPTAPTRKQHEAWFAAWMARPDCARWIVRLGEQRVGLIWAERAHQHAAHVSINLASSVRGNGLGPVALRAVVPLIRQEWDAVVLAYILPGNTASMRCFERAGFQCSPLAVTYKGREARLYAA